MKARSANLAHMNFETIMALDEKEKQLMKIVSKSKVIGISMIAVDFCTFRIRVDRIGYTHMIKRTDLEIYNLQRLLQESEKSDIVQYERPDIFIAKFEPYEYMKQKKYSFVWEFFWPRTKDETDFYQERKDSGIHMDVDNSSFFEENEPLNQFRRKSTGFINRFSMLIGGANKYCK
jgi:hypothetical protein